MSTVTTVADKPCAISNAGSRLSNEDAIYPQPETLSHRQRLFIVCDGVGGSEKGEVASALACEAIQSYFAAFLEGDPTPEFVQKAIRYTETRFDEYIACHPETQGMSTTLTLLYVGDRYVLVAHVGDSRIYQFREGCIQHRTEDHSLVNSWIKLGKISYDEARNHPQRNIILKAIGSSARPVEAEINVLYDIQEGDSFFLCTDGVLEAVTDESLAELFDGNRPADVIKDSLVEVCSLRSRDNYSFYIVPILRFSSMGGMKQNILLFLNVLL
ncbi:MAG: protein phosphatase 2C domain-containing protein [Tannerellaceae bacterium]|jgi:protein phosphatase|nr:protein phosphatase 2C domain-containing protein [Tannerellaceae bacterium]